MFLSVVTKSPDTAASASAIGEAGGPLSKSMGIDHVGWLLRGEWRVKAARREFDHRYHLFTRQ